jgi:hypothetical protein
LDYHLGETNLVTLVILPMLWQKYSYAWLYYIRTCFGGFKNQRVASRKDPGMIGKMFQTFTYYFTH